LSAGRTLIMVNPESLHETGSDTPITVYSISKAPRRRQILASSNVTMADNGFHIFS